jgi:hypothetical protein
LYKCQVTCRVHRTEYGIEHHIAGIQPFFQLQVKEKTTKNGNTKFPLFFRFLVLPLKPLILLAFTFFTFLSPFSPFRFSTLFPLFDF